MFGSVASPRPASSLSSNRIEIDSLQVRRAGFPTRIVYREFVRDFRVFTPRGARPADDKALAEAMMRHPHVTERVAPRSWRSGNTKIFMQADVLYTLQSLKNRIIYPYVRRLQRWFVQKKGNVSEYKLARYGNQLADIKGSAASKGLATHPKVAAALKAAEAAATQAAASRQLGDIGKLGKAVEAIAAALDAADADYQLVLKVRGEYTTKLDSGKGRIAHCKNTAASLYSLDDQAALDAQCKAASDALETTRTNVLAAARCATVL